MARIIEVRLKDQQGEADLYTKGIIFKKVYIRQTAQDNNDVQWLAAKKADSGYEAGKPVKAGVTVRVVKGKRKEKETIFEEMTVLDESGFPRVDTKAYSFVHEQVPAEAKDYAQQNKLYTLDAWKKWLLVDCAHYSYKGSEENWLYFAARKLNEQAVVDLDIQGRAYTIWQTQWKHQVSQKTWSVYEIKNPNGEVVTLCGIAYQN